VNERETIKCVLVVILKKKSLLKGLFSLLESSVVGGGGDTGESETSCCIRHDKKHKFRLRLAGTARTCQFAMLNPYCQA